MTTLLRFSVSIFLLLLLTGCSAEEESSVQKKMEEQGHKAAAEIQTTLQQAELAGQLQDAHNQVLEEAAKE